jgi:membrane-bound metal-dependent hydrolase YbcI (DUF457 family)
MPITPFHFGPGAALHAAVPQQVSFLSFCAANVLIDVEPLYFIVTDQYPLHRFLHTLGGATVAVMVTTAFFMACLKLSRLRRLPNPLGWQQLTLLPVVLGAALGAYSHILLDAVMHGDMMPFAPFSQANPLLYVVSIEALQWGCVAAGAVGLAVLGLRRRQEEQSAKG